MNWKNRLTNYNFWISIISAVLLIFQAFNINFDIAYVNEIATAVLGLLVVIGIISDPTKTYSKTETNSQQVVDNASEDENKNRVLEKSENNVETKAHETENLTFPVEIKTEDDNSDDKIDFQNIIDGLMKIVEKFNTVEKKETVEETDLEEVLEIVDEEQNEETSFKIVN